MSPVEPALLSSCPHACVDAAAVGAIAFPVGSVYSTVKVAAAWPMESLHDRHWDRLLVMVVVLSKPDHDSLRIGPLEV